MKAIVVDKDYGSVSVRELMAVSYTHLDVYKRQLVHRTGGIHQHVLHGDYILHHERLFYDSQSHEDQIYSGGRHACDLCRACGQRGAGWYDGGRVRGFLSFIRESGIKTLLGTLRIIGPDE